MRLIAALLLSLAALPAAACSIDTDCIIGDRSYRLYVPAGADAPLGALFYAHGYRGSAEGAMRNQAFMRLADDLGMAFVALDSFGDDWNLAHRPRDPAQQEAAEYAYVAAVLTDLNTRIELDPDRTVLSGFSAGGMFTWTIACGMSDAFAGYVPMSGTFWAPVPPSCPTPPANLVHIHGTEDGVVPLEGRPIGRARQGEVPLAMALYGDHAGASGAMNRAEAPGEMTCDRYEPQAIDVLEICYFDGGHSFSVQRLHYGIQQVLGEG